MNRYIFPIFLVLLSAGVYIMYIDPLYAAITAGNTKIAEYNSLLKDAEEATTKIDELEAVQSKFPSGYDQSLETILPASIDPLKLVIEINGIAAMRGLQIKSPTVTPSTDSKKVANGVNKNMMTFTISAPYDVFRSFLKDLESNLSLQDLSQLSFTSKEGDATNYDRISPELRPYDYQVSMVTYSLPQ